MAKKFYKIAGLGLELDCDVEMIPRYFDSFEDETVKHLEDTVRIKLVYDITPPEYDMTKEVIRNRDVVVYDENDSYVIEYRLTGSLYYGRFNKDKPEAIMYCKYKLWASDHPMLGMLRDIFFFYLQKKDVLVVHSASIQYDSKAYLFSGKSGAGKSTHAKLWKEYNSDVTDINGDVCAIYFADDKLMVQGLPWHGTSYIFGNVKAPLGAVMYIEQSSENLVEQMSKSRGTIELISRSLYPSWTKEQVLRTVEIANRFGNFIEYATLKCDISRGAYETCKSYFEEL